jgi:membrane protein
MRFFLLLPRAALALPIAARNALKHGSNGEAARLAYFFFLSLFPLMLVVFALSGYVGGARSFRFILDAVEQIVPPESTPMLERFANKLAGEHRPDVLSAGLALAAWSASGVFAALCEALNRIHGGEHTTGWLHRRMRAALLLAVVCALLSLVFSALLLLPGMLHLLGLHGMTRAFGGPLVFLLVCATLFCVLYLLPDRDLRKQRTETAAGAVLGATLLFLAAWIFRRYVSHISNFSAVYGVVAGTILLLIWMYVTSLIVLLAAEVGSVLAGARASRPRTA